MKLESLHQKRVGCKYNENAAHENVDMKSLDCLI